MSIPPAPKSEAVRRALRFLLVDDEPPVLRALGRILRQRRPEWEIHCETSGAAALERLAATHIDCVMTDLQMPNMTGVTLLELIRVHHPGCVRLVHSSQIETIGREQVAALCQRMLDKPASPEQVIATLDWGAELVSRMGLSGTGTL